MAKIQLDGDEQGTLRSLWDTESDAPVRMEAIESLIQKGILCRRGTDQRGKEHVDMTPLGEQICESLFGDDD